MAASPHPAFSRHFGTVVHLLSSCDDWAVFTDRNRWPVVVMSSVKPFSVMKATLQPFAFGSMDLGDSGTLLPPTQLANMREYHLDKSRR